MVGEERKTRVRNKEEKVPAMVLAMVPTAFILRTDHYTAFTYLPGVQEMPLAHALHPYSKDSGVVQYTIK